MRTLKVIFGQPLNKKMIYYMAWFFAFLISCYACFAAALEKTSCCFPQFEKSLSSSIPLEIDATLALEDFRSLPDGSWNGNWGAYGAMHLKVFLPRNVSIQLAGSYGLYDWAGRAFVSQSLANSLQQQGFVTFALTRQISCTGLNVAIAYDWMFNKDFGLFSVNPCFDQIRGQVGYLIRGGNELGIWASYGIHEFHTRSQQLSLQFRGISQVNLFWCHYFKNHGYGMLWAGMPYRQGLMYSSGRPGNFIFGLQFSLPVTQHLSIEGHGVYMSPRRVAGIQAVKNDASNLSIGLTYSFGRTRIQRSPYMNLANNSTFLADTNHNF